MDAGFLRPVTGTSDGGRPPMIYMFTDLGRDLRERIRSFGILR
jgi:hypothetical protein